MENGIDDTSDAAARGLKGEAGAADLCRDPNRHARPASVEFAGEEAVVLGYQEFRIGKNALAPLPGDRYLQARTEILAPYFTPTYLAERRVLDLGSNGGYFSFWALRSGAERATAVDLDAGYLQRTRRIADRLGIANLDTVCQNVEDWREPRDVVLALALIHWIYSCTATFGSLDKAIGRLAEITRYMLLVEWVDPADPAIEFFGHLSWNGGLQKGSYGREELTGALARHFPRVELAGLISPTRAIYAAFRTPHPIDLSAPLPRLFPKESIVSSRLLARLGTRKYWSVVYDRGDSVVKQGSRDLASREAKILRQLSGRFTPRVIRSSESGTESAVELEKIPGDPLEAAAPTLRADRKAMLAFFRDFLELLAELRRAGILHRDIRPDNVLVRSGRPVLIDFGWASGGGIVPLTPPELGFYVRPPDGTHSDVYAAGKLLLDLNRGSVPELDGIAAVMSGGSAAGRIDDPEALVRLFDLLFAERPAPPSGGERELETSLRRVLEAIGGSRRAAAEAPGTGSPETRIRELALEIAERDRAIAAMTRELSEAQAFNAAVGGDLDRAQKFSSRAAREYEQRLEDLRRQLDEALGSLAGYRDGPASLESVKAISEQRAKHLEFATSEVARLRSELESARGETARALRSPFRAKLRQLFGWDRPLYRIARAMLPARLGRWLKSKVAPEREASSGESPRVEPRRRPMLPSGKYDVIVFSVIDWDFRFQRPQQISTQFGRGGHRVLYLSTTDFLVDAGQKWSTLPKQPGVFELKVGAGRNLDIYGGTMDSADVGRLEEAFASLAEEWAIGDAVCLLEIAFWTPLALRLRDRFGWKIAYDCMDEWTNFPGFGPSVLDIEAGLVRDADLTIVSADRLEEKWRSSARRLIMARNGIDLDHYKSLYGENRLLGDASRPVLGYFGALASWVDVELLVRIAKKYPAATLVLAGGEFDVDLARLKSLPNVRLIGQRPYEEMPKLLWNFDVCLIPFLINDITEATNPVKFYEYLFSGKPVVGSELHELRTFGNLCYLARTHEEFLARLDEALREEGNDPRRTRRKEAAAANSWSARYEAIDAAVREAFPRVSVVVVTYNGIALTRDCLDSLLGAETWPNLEVVVVDNASSDGTPAYLAGVEARDPRVRVVRNARNAGFAAANNIGIGDSSGEIVVLLNNDTVVPPGLLGRLVAHLRRDPSLGLLCPTTNFCGNEAKVDPGYSDLRDLPWFAAEVARKHAGVVFDLPVAAMYCVAMRREVAEKVGPLEEAFGIGMFEDDDYAMRIRQAGFRVACARDAYVHHVGQGSFSKLSADDYNALWKKNQAYFEKKWGVEWKPHRVREGVAAPVSKISG